MLVDNVLDVSLEELKFDMTGNLEGDESGSVEMNVGTRIGKTGIEEGIGYTHAQLVLFIGKGAQKRISENEVDYNGTNNYFQASFLITFEIAEDFRNKISPDELQIKASDEILSLVEPYFKEIISNTFARSSYPTPQLQKKFWRG